MESKKKKKKKKKDKHLSSVGENKLFNLPEEKKNPSKLGKVLKLLRIKCKKNSSLCFALEIT